MMLVHERETYVKSKERRRKRGIGGKERMILMENQVSCSNLDQN